MSAAASAVGLHPCARCAQVQRTCCQRAEILLTEGDLGRIAGYLGDHPAVAADVALPRDEPYHEWRVPQDPAYLEPDEEDPQWLALTTRADGSRRLLRRRENGDCTFLGPAGCVLSLEARPLVCRLYPLAYTEAGLGGSDEEYCPTWLLAADGRSMETVLEIDRTQARAWHAQLYDELHRGQP